MRELDTLCKIDVFSHVHVLQEGAARGNDLTSKLKGANQRLELL